MTETSIDRAGQSVATHFSRLMKATTSPWGLLTDPPLVAGATAPFLVGFVAAVQLESRPSTVLVLEVLSALPVVSAVLVLIALSTARRKVVEWIARQPFPVENMNGVLNGLGEAIEVTFSTRVPETPFLNAKLDELGGESFVTKSPAPEDSVLRTVEIHIGVVESKRNPSASNYRRYQRVCALVEHVLAPLSQEFPIAEVRVK